MAFETPFAHVLDTNYAPSSEEQTTIKALIIEPEDRIHQLEEDISRLEAECNKLKRFVDRHRALLAPFRRLPADVWREIFTFCLLDNKFGLSLRSTSQAPLLLTTICQSWRNISLNTPQLWNSIHIHIPAPSSSGPFRKDLLYPALRARKEGLERWLQRSGSLPLTISMSVELHNLEGEGVEMDAIGTEFIEVFMKHCRRWKTLVLGTHGRHLIALDELGADDLPQLENVHTSGSMLFQRHGQGPQLAHFGDFLTRATSFRSLNMANEWTPVRLLDFGVKWSNLTELRITSPLWQSSEPDLFAPGTFLRALAKQCSSLVIFSLTRFSFYDDRLRPLDTSLLSTTPLPWPTIREFTFSARDPGFENFMDIIRDAFEQITLPSVERLSITLDCYNSIYNPATSAPDGPEAPWGRFLLRSQPPVKHLELSISPSEWGIRAALRSLKPLCGLKSLRIRYGVAWSTGYEELVRGLREPFEGGPLCPELEKLEFEECVASDMEVILTLADHHSSMGRPNLKLIRAKFALPTEYYGESQEGFDVSATKDCVTWTRKANLGATVVLAWSRSQVDPHYRDSPSTGIPVFAGGYPSWP